MLTLFYPDSVVFFQEFREKASQLAAAKRSERNDDSELLSHKDGADGKKDAAEDMESPETSGRQRRVYSVDDPEDEIDVVSARAEDKRSNTMSPIQAAGGSASGSGRGTPASASVGGAGGTSSSRAAGSVSPVPSHLQQQQQVSSSAKTTSPSHGGGQTTAGGSEASSSPFGAAAAGSSGSGLSPLQPRRTMQSLPHHVPKLDSLSKKLDDIRKNMGEEVSIRPGTNLY
jgi:hypothetical protein